MSARTADTLPGTTDPFPAGQGGSDWLIPSKKGESATQWISLLNTVTWGTARGKTGKKKIEN